MNKNDILLIGIGQAGNNIVNDLMYKDRRYKGLFINTCNNDMKNLKNAKDKYLTSNTDGTGRNRELAKQYVVDNLHSMMDQIEKYPMHNVLYFFFSGGGGTGSGMSPALIKIAKGRFPHKKMCAVIILPSLKEGITSQENAIKCWNELLLCDADSIMVLDNEKRVDKNQVNTEFCEIFDEFISMGTPKSDDEEDEKEKSKKDIKYDKNDIIDTKDMETIALSKGLTIIYKLNNTKEDIKIKLYKAMEDSVFATYQSNKARYIGLSVTKGIDTDKLLNEFNGIKEPFINKNEESNLIILGGCEPDISAIELLNENIKEFKLKDNIDIDYANFIVDTEFVEESTMKNNTSNKIIKDDKDLEELIDSGDFWNLFN